MEVDQLELKLQVMKMEEVNTKSEGETRFEQLLSLGWIPCEKQGGEKLDDLIFSMDELEMNNESDKGSEHRIIKYKIIWINNL